MADPFSIAASCVGLLAAISTATIRISEFVHNARTARTDLDAVSRELGSLRTVLELIQTDAENSQNQLPQTIVHHLCEVLTNCNGAVADIETVLRKYEKSDAVTSSRWALSGRGDVEKLRAHLEAHTSALGLVLDMMNLVVSIKVRQETSTIHAQTTDIKLDTANILAKIDQLQARLPSLGAEEKDDYMLQRYLEEMTTYTEGMLSSVEPEDGLALEAADGEMVALERFLNDPDDSSKASTQLTPPPSTSAAAEPPQVQQLPVRVPQSGKGKFALFSGNLVIDIPLPQKTLSKFPHAPDGGRDEFTHVRYTAVTCDPDSFHEKGYSLRAGLFAKPRTTDLLFSVFFDTGHRATVFDVLSKVWDAMDHFHQLSLLGPLAFKEVRWKHVVLHLHFATLPTGESASCLDAISSRPMWYEGPGLSLFSEMSSVNGESVLWQMYEYTTQLHLGPSPVSYSGTLSRHPMQTIVTHGTKSSKASVPSERLSAWKAWRNTIRRGLEPRVSVFGDSEEAFTYLRPWSLGKAWSRSLAAMDPANLAGSHEVSLVDLWDWSDRLNTIKALLS